FCAATRFNIRAASLQIGKLVHRAHSETSYDSVVSSVPCLIYLCGETDQKTQIPPINILAKMI
ncbi:MAG: hypothetical protein IJB48_05230, partial [Clostridia bacterium]|nr:hypothetical protein [Clostridia bacterium]